MSVEIAKEKAEEGRGKSQIRQQGLDELISSTARLRRAGSLTLSSIQLPFLIKQKASKLSFISWHIKVMYRELVRQGRIYDFLIHAERQCISSLITAS